MKWWQEILKDTLKAMLAGAADEVGREAVRRIKQRRKDDDDGDETKSEKKTD